VLALLELALRLSGAAFVPRLSSIEFGWPDPKVLHDVYLEDPQLFWVPKRYPAALQSVRRDLPLVVFMGDSCTELGSYPQLFKQRVHERFPAAPIAYFSAGVGGWSSYQGLRQFQRDLIPLQPKVVTVYYGWNDHWTGFGLTDAEAGEIADGATSWGGLRLAQLLFRARLRYRHPLVGNRPNRVSEQEFHDNLAAIARLGKASGIVTVLLTAPTSHQRGAEPKYLAERWLRDLDDLVPLHQAYAEQARRVAAEEQVPLCDLAGDFAALDRAELERHFTQDGIHLSDEGNRKVAASLFACFERNQLFSTPLAADRP